MIVQVDGSSAASPFRRPAATPGSDKRAPSRQSHGTWPSRGCVVFCRRLAVWPRPSA